jgi:hypothetical protein
VSARKAGTKARYVEALIEKSKEILAQCDNVSQLRAKKKAAQKKYHKRKTLTVSAPFALRTQQRVRIDTT